MRVTYFAAAAAAIISAAPTMAQSIDFSSPVVTGNSAAAGVWYKDRFVPAGFEVSGGQLLQSIAGADLQGSAFYNTQGRKFDLDEGVTSLSIDLNVDASWANVDKRWAGLWGTSFDGDGNVAGYPIVEFTTVGGLGQFRGWDSNEPGGFFNIGSAFAIGQGGVFTLGIQLVGNQFIYTAGALTGSVDAGDSVSIGNVILQGYNSGGDYTIAWDNLEASAAVPEAATWAMMLGGFGMIGGAIRRRRTAIRFA